MNIHTIDLNLQLGNDQLMDIFILQWPTTFSNYDQFQILPQLAEERASLLENFRNWLFNYFDQKTPSRPLFIVAPEVSMPKRYINLLNEIVGGLNRPTVVIAGLEYLSWDEYNALIKNMPDMPSSETWFEGGNDNHIVNAAGIWIREYNGGHSDELSDNIRRHLQPKCHPYDQEHPYLYPCQDVLLFRSQKQVPGARLNFCVQICSDFSSANFVQNLRKNCAGECSGLDITFLLQHNENQEADQIKQTIKEYFDPPIHKVETDGGCLIFINRANDNIGKTKKWGKSKFLFHFRQKWRHLVFPSPTFWLKDEAANNHQAVILRESGPCLYWLVYKPVNLVDSIAGSGQPMPFPGEQAYCAIIKKDSFGENERDDQRFVPLQPLGHWFRGELYEAKREVKSWLKVCGVNESIADDYLSSYNQGVGDWLKIIGQRERLIRSVIETYFIACNYNQKYSDKDLTRCTNLRKETEPQKWSLCISEGIKEMMKVYALLQMGAHAFPGGKIMPKVRPFSHASNTGDTFKIAFMWGCNNHNNQVMPQTMITIYLNTIQTNGLADQLYGNCLLVLVNPKGNPSQKDIITFIHKTLPDIARGAQPDNAPDHLKQPGDVVMPNTKEGFRCICDHNLFGEFDAAEDVKDLEKRLKVFIENHVMEAQIP